ncbi:Hypothetical predicted protein [Mytilus galloprovincialis]|uniref:Uncharacterized protein n=1 Tax=Mytilus galloprovincialis TaxID=29158 RepID=A0A8B6CT02_MYTGA|nr:Hypothetical predicted protein [Mytilus galloprovincialis]
MPTNNGDKPGDGKKVLKKKRSNAKGKFHRILNRFNKSHHNNESKESLELILKDLEDAYSEMEGVMPRTWKFWILTTKQIKILLSTVIQTWIIFIKNFVKQGQ